MGASFIGPSRRARGYTPAMSRGKDATLGVAEEQLRRIEAVTDAGLAHLEVGDLLDELLDRVRDLLAVDTIAVLLMDNAGRYLDATAARGLEEEVRQGVRIPLGQGFAGRIAARRQPAVLDNVTDGDVVNPILLAKGIRSMLGVPLLSGGSVIGVLHVGTLVPRAFTDADAKLLQLVADRVALAAQASTSQAERAAAAVLQRSLLPDELPTVPGLQFGSRYVPGGAGDVGGDWYDVFLLPSGWLFVVMGDVVGRGLPAAVAMGRLRSTLRAYALESATPAALLERLDRQLQHFEPRVMATVLCAMVAPSRDTVVLSSAGHPPPITVRPGEPAAVVELPSDRPIGVAVTRRRSDTTVPLPPGTVVCFYTDGLIERRHRSLEVGIELLRQALAAGPPETVCARVMLKLVGAETVGDDIALLVLRREDAPMAPLELNERAVPESLRTLRNAARQWLADVGADPAVANDVLLAVGEACSNVVEHAYGPRGGTVHLRLAVEDRHIVARVRDTGQWRRARGTNRGRGIRLMEGISDDVRVDTSGTGTEVMIRKSLTGSPWT